MRRTPPAPDAPTLFDITLLTTTTTPDIPCMWHRKDTPTATHRVVTAVDLMHPWWWQWGGLRADGALTACNGRALRLHTVGAGYCTGCVERDAGAQLTRRGTVTHFTPIAPAA